MYDVDEADQEPRDFWCKFWNRDTQFEQTAVEPWDDTLKRSSKAFPKMRRRQSRLTTHIRFGKPFINLCVPYRAAGYDTWRAEELQTLLYHGKLSYNLPKSFDINGHKGYQHMLRKRGHYFLLRKVFQKAYQVETNFNPWLHTKMHYCRRSNPSGMRCGRLIGQCAFRADCLDVRLGTFRWDNRPCTNASKMWLEVRQSDLKIIYR